MQSNNKETYLEQFGQGSKIWEIRQQLLKECFEQNISALRVYSVIEQSKLLAIYALQKGGKLGQQIQSDLIAVMELIPVEELEKDNWHYTADSDHPNILETMLGLLRGNIREYNRLYREAILRLQHLNIGNNGYFDPNRKQWKQELYNQKYSEYIALLREMCELKIINKMIEEKWRNAPDLE